MSQESDEREDMRPQYDIRRGERGKYFIRYGQGVTMRVTFEESAWIASSTTSAPELGSITKTAAYPPAYPSPKIQGVEAATAA
jgi:hypothetical protein